MAKAEPGVARTSITTEPSTEGTAVRNGSPGTIKVKVATLDNEPGPLSVTRTLISWLPTNSGVGVQSSRVKPPTGTKVAPGSGLTRLNVNCWEGTSASDAS